MGGWGLGRWLGAGLIGLGLIGVGLILSSASAETLLRRGGGAEPGTLDPGKFESVPEDYIISDLYEGLIATGPGGKLVPGQAESWSASADGLIWHFTLRPDLHWSNGDPLTATDFVYSFRRLVDPANAFHIAFLAEPIAHAHGLITGTEHDLDALGVVAVDDQHLDIRLETPNAALPAILSRIRPVHRASVEAYGREAFRPGHLVSNGAYQLETWEPQARMILARNPRYWDASHVGYDRVEIDPIEDEHEELKRYRAGDLDLTLTVPSDQTAFIQATMPAELHVTPLLGLYYIGLNLTRPPFAGAPQLREALALALDREILCSKVAGGGVTPAYGIIPPHMGGYDYPTVAWAGLDRTAREAKARALYQAAGYSAEHPLKVDLTYNTSDNHRKLMIAIAGMWKQVLGVETRLTNMEFKTFLDFRTAKKGTEAFRGGFIALYDDPAPILEILRTNAPYNDLGYSDPAFDQAYEAGITAPTLADRLARLAEAETVALNAMPLIPIYHYVDRHLIKPTVEGWEPSPRDSFRSQDLHPKPAG